MYVNLLIALTNSRQFLNIQLKTQKSNGIYKNRQIDFNATRSTKDFDFTSGCFPKILNTNFMAGNSCNECPVEMTTLATPIEYKKNNKPHFLTYIGSE